MAIDLSADASDNDEDKQRDANINVSLSLPSHLSSFFSNLTHRVPSSSSSSSVTVPSKRKTDTDADSKDTSTTVFPPPTDLASTSTSINGSSHAHAGHGRDRGRADYHVAKKQSPGSRTLNTPSPGLPNTQQSTVSVVIHSPSYEKKREIQNAQWTRVRPPPAAPSVSGLSKRRYSSTDHHQRSRRQPQKGTGDVHTARTVDATGATATGAKKDKVDRRAVSLRIGRPTVPILTDRPSTQIKQQLYRSFLRKLSKIQGPPVTLSRDIDDHVLTGIAANFEFVNEYKLRKGVVPVGEDFNGGCDCSNVCDPLRCSCLSDAEETDEKLLPYQTAPDDVGMIVLTPEFRQRRSMIYECNSRCGCRGKCWNNVVQRGRTVRFEILHTGNRGFGLRSPDFIRAGQFVDIYLGEVITLQTANVRSRLAAAEHAHCYLFDLDFLISDDTIYVIDGQKLGSPTRFMNHSCNPNCRMFPVSRNHGDNRLYDLAFFALRDIEPMTELTFDYNPGPVDADPDADEDSDSDEDSDLEIDHRKHRAKGTSNAVKCLCGEPNCRGQLWTAQRKGTK